MEDSKTTKNGSADTGIRPDLEGEEYRDGEFYKPISTREYFKLLGYCVIGFIIIGLAFVLFAILT